MWMILVLASDRRRPIGARTVATSSRSCFGVGSGAVNHHHEVVRIADQSVVRLPAWRRDAAGGRRAHRLPGLGEMIVEHGQGDVGQQRRQDPPCGVPVLVFRDAVLTEDPGLQERLHQRQDAFVPDPSTHPVHQGRVVDVVEARLDVAFQHPLIRAGPEQVDLSDRVVRPPLRAEPIGARVEIRLEDRLKHQLQGGLHDPVPHGRDPQPAQLAAGLGDHPLPRGQRSKPPAFSSSRRSTRNSATSATSTGRDAVNTAVRLPLGYPAPAARPPPAPPGQRRG